MKTLKTIFLMAALIVPGVAFAGAPWSFVDVGYVTGDSGDDRTDGINLRGSFGFAEIWHVGANINSTEFSGGKSKPGGADTTGFNIFVGLNPALTDNTDLVLDLGYEGIEVDFGGPAGENDITSVFLRAGPRALLGEKFELSGYLIVEWGEDETGSVDTDFTEVGAQVGGAFYFSPSFSIGADARLNEDKLDDLVNIYLRLSFQ